MARVARVGPAESGGVMPTNLSRRSLIAGLGALLAAPAIVRASSLDPLSFRKFAEPPLIDVTSIPIADFMSPWPVAAEQIHAGDLVRLSEDGRTVLRWRGADLSNADRIMGASKAHAPGERVNMDAQIYMERVLY